MRFPALLALSLLGACSTRDRYLIAPPLLLRAAQLDPATLPRAAIPVQKERERKPAYLRAAFLPPEALQLAPHAPPELPVRVEVRGKNPVVTAGIVLTCVGSVISVGASLWYLATLREGGDVNMAGGLLALGAEPLMWVGTVLWPLGIVRPPWEARPGRRDVQYLGR